MKKVLVIVTVMVLTMMLSSTVFAAKQKFTRDITPTPTATPTASRGTSAGTRPSRPSTSGETSTNTRPSTSTPAITPVAKVVFEDYVFPVNGEKLGDRNPVISGDFPGEIYNVRFEMFKKEFSGEIASTGDNLGICILVRLNEGYSWADVPHSSLNGKEEEARLKTADMKDNEKGFIYSFRVEETKEIEITEQSPEEVKYTAGEDVTLFVKATGAETYQWYKYGGTTSSGGGAKQKYSASKIEGATSDTYIVKAAPSELDGAGFYCYLTTKDGLGKKSNVFVLKLDETAEKTAPEASGEKAETTTSGEKAEPTTSGETAAKPEEKKGDKKSWKKASDWAEEELNKANDLDLIPDIFNNGDLTADITRKEFAHVAVRLYEKVSGTKAIATANNPFADTKDTEILKALNVGITNGTSDTTFEPDALITREQMATMMTRALTKAGIDTKVDLTKVSKFADDGELNDWGRTPVYYMSNIGIIKGVGNNKFDVNGKATKEQSLLISERSAVKFAK